MGNMRQYINKRGQEGEYRESYRDYRCLLSLPFFDMKMIMTEFRGKRKGFFRPKPICVVGKTHCPRCGSSNHIGDTTCIVKTLPWKDER